MITQTPQLRKIAIRKRASHPSSVREPNKDFRKLVDKQEQAESTMKLEEREKVKLQYINNIQSTTSELNHIHYSDAELDEKNSSNINYLQEKSKL